MVHHGGVRAWDVDARLQGSGVRVLVVRVMGER